MKADLTVEFNKFLSNIEVDKVGVISLEDYRDSKAWQQARNLLPESKSVVVLALEIFPEVIKHLSSKNLIGEIALRDLFSRNIEIINARIDWEAHKIVKKLHTLGYSALCLPAGGAPLESRFLEGAFSYKHAAHAAGLGVIGWHSMLITPEYGTRVRLAVILTNAQLKPKISIAEKAVP